MPLPLFSPHSPPAIFACFHFTPPSPTTRCCARCSTRRKRPPSHATATLTAAHAAAHRRHVFPPLAVQHQSSIFTPVRHCPRHFCRRYARQHHYAITFIATRQKDKKKMRMRRHIPQTRCHHAVIVRSSAVVRLASDSHTYVRLFLPAPLFFTFHALPPPACPPADAPFPSRHARAKPQQVSPPGHRDAVAAAPRSRL